MKRTLTGAALATIIISLILMAYDLIFGQTNAEKACSPANYDCNYQNYLRDIDKRPPDFSNAGSLAIMTDDAIRSNISAIFTSDGYTSASMIRVILHYPPQVRRRICDDSALLSRIKSHGRGIEGYEREEFERLLGDLECKGK